MRAEYTPEQIARFHTKYVITAGCWLWTDGKFPTGYGRFSVDQRPVGAHRVMWSMVNGPIPAGLLVRHACDVKACVNPAHLLIGTYKDNAHDAMARGRHTCQQPNWQERLPLRAGVLNPAAKLDEAAVIEIRRQYARGGWTMKRLGQAFNVTAATVCSIVLRQTWAHID